MVAALLCSLWFLAGAAALKTESVLLVFQAGVAVFGENQRLRVSLEPARLVLLGRIALILVKFVLNRELSKSGYQGGRSHLPLFRYY